jgi:hypothetical protein
MPFNGSSTLHRMRAQLVLAAEQQRESRRCHDRAVAALARGEAATAAEWQICAAHHHECSVFAMSAAFKRHATPRPQGAPPAT